MPPLPAFTTAASLCACELRRARMEFLAAAQERVLRADQVMGELRWALRRQFHAAVSLPSAVRKGLAELVRGAVRLQLLEESLPPQPDLAGVMQTLSALHLGRIKLLADLSEALRLADLVSTTFVEVLDQDRRLRDELDCLLGKLPPPAADNVCPPGGCKISPR